jgi:hypothetical protein
VNSDTGKSSRRKEDLGKYSKDIISCLTVSAGFLAMLNLVASRLFFEFVARHLEVDDLIRVVDWWMFTQSWAIMVIPPRKVIFDQWLIIIRLPGLFLSLGEATFDLFLTLLPSPEDVLLWLKTIFFDLWQGNSPARSHEKRKATRRRDVSAPDCKETSPVRDDQRLRTSMLVASVLIAEGPRTERTITRQRNETGSRAEAVSA